MPRGRKPKGFNIVTEEPAAIPAPNVHVLKAERVPEFDVAREEVLSEFKESGTLEEVIDRLYKKYEELSRGNETVVYVSDVQNLNLMVEVLRPAPEGGISVQHVVVEFRRGRLEVQDPYLIKALERHPSFGGEGDSLISDSPSPLFWRKTFPSWKWEEIEGKQAALSPVPREEQ